MNSFFIKLMLTEISSLRETSLDSIKSVLTGVAKKKKKYKYEEAHSNFIQDFAKNNLTKKQINAYLNKKYKDGKISDYIEIRFDENTNEYEYIEKKYDRVFNIDNVPLIMKINLELDNAFNTPIVNIITIYEKFLRNLLIYDCQDGNNDLIMNETISFQQLSSLDCNIDNIKEYMIEYYCNKKLYGDNKRINNIISTLKINCDDCQDLIDDFNEIYFRRNMYVHSIPNLTDDYKTLPKAIIEKWTTDGKLNNNAKYFKHAFTTLRKIIFMILIKKFLYKERDEKALEDIENLIYDEIYDKRQYETAVFCYNQLRHLKFITRTDRYLYFINYMHCLKKLNNTEELEKEISNWNTETDATLYKIMKKLITDDYENINELIRTILLTDDEIHNLTGDTALMYLSEDCIEKWPIFEDYRKTEHYSNLLTGV